MNTKLITIQEMIFDEMKRLSDDKLMNSAGNNEVLRSNALTNSATAYLKSVNTSLRIKEIAQKNDQTVKDLTKELGIAEK